MRKFLEAKHWQLFCAMFAIPFIYDALFFPQSSSKRTVYFDCLELLASICLMLIFGWFWAIAIKLQHKIPGSIQMKTTKFKILFFISLIYISIMFIFISFVSRLLPGDLGQYDTAYEIVIIGVITLPLFSMFGIFYCMYFAAKTLKTAELQREVNFREFANEFFMLWFYPIGIWFIQPRVNKLSM
jgi:hypothetical protein